MSNTPYTLACQSQGRVQHGSILSGNLRPTRVTSQWKSTTNPASPFERLPRTTILAVRIKSVSPLGANVAQVRFETERRDQGQVEGPKQDWVSIIRYRFIDAPMAMEDRLVNPLGFQVLRYRRDQEAPDTAPASAPPVEPAVQIVPSQQRPAMQGLRP